MKIKDLSVGDMVWVVPWRHKKPIQIEVRSLHEKEKVVCGVEIVNSKHITVRVDWCGDSSREARKLVEKREDREPKKTKKTKKTKRTRKTK